MMILYFFLDKKIFLKVVLHFDFQPKLAPDVVSQLELYLTGNTFQFSEVERSNYLIWQHCYSYLLVQ
jgi:hypothetical protein